MVILLIPVTILIFISHYSIGVRYKLQHQHQKIIIAGLLTCGQIILTELALGIAGQLYLPVLVLLNLAIAAAVSLKAGAFEKNEYRDIITGIRNASAMENVFLALLAGVVIVYLGMAISSFPVRMWDDLRYHLPPIYEYIIDHHVSLLPVDFNRRFAFPENAEFLFMWPAIFLHAQKFVQSPEIPVALWGVVIIYGLARLAGIAPRIACFVGLLFFFTPLVLFQMENCYTDLIHAVFFLALVYCAGTFYKTGRFFFFYAAALAAGLLWGMKYTQIIFILLVMPILGLKGTARFKHWICFGAVFLAAGGFWYLRNWLVLKTPVYPIPFSPESVRIYDAHPSPGNVIELLKQAPAKLLFLWKDIGLGSLHGGYGLIFWGLGFPAWAYVWARAMVHKDQFKIWLYALLVAGVVQVILVSPESFRWVPRYSLFIPAIGLLALGEVLTVFNPFAFFINAVKTFCILSAVLSMLLLNSGTLGNSDYGLNVPVKDFLEGKYISKPLYPQPGRDRIWALMDYLTANDRKGLSYYMVPLDYYKIAYIYGAHLQNRIWNFQPDKSSAPDGFILYGRSKKTIIGPDYLLAEKWYLNVFVREDFFQDHSKRQLLADYKTMEEAH